MDLKQFYFDNIKEDEYHYKFYESISNVNQCYNYLTGNYEINNYSFNLFDTEECIMKFKKLCLPEVTYDNENTAWFHLISYYLNKLGYEIKEFPRILARPPVNPNDFAYTEIRNYLIAKGMDDNGTVRYATRRAFVSELTFVFKSNHLDLNESIEQKFKEISTREASFNDMSLDEKLSEISNLIENLLKVDGKFIKLDFTEIAFDYLSDDSIKKYRKQIQCFRHASNESISERSSFTEEQKMFLIDYGILALKSINEITKQKLHTD